MPQIVAVAARRITVYLAGEGFQHAESAILKRAGGHITIHVTFIISKEIINRI